ncbi:MAG TPA: hypothetical protein VF786_09325 [Terriglobales bacterium]
MKKRILCILLLTACAALAQSGKPAASVAYDENGSAPAELRDEATSHSNAVLSPGTPIYFRLEQIISTRDNRPGEKFVGRVTRPVIVNGRTVVPAGSHLNGTILQSEEPRRIFGHSSIGLRPEHIILADGTTLTISAIIVDTNDPHRYSVTEEGRIKGPGVEDLTKIETIALSGSGAIGGLIVGGPVGMLIGAGSGAAVSGGHALIKRHEMVVPTTLEIITELSREATVSSNARAGLSE